MFPISLTQALNERRESLTTLVRALPARAEARLPGWLRRKPVPEATIAALRAPLETWLAGKPVSEIDFVLDGPGYGCTQMYFLMGLLGAERLTRFRKVHAFSASSYAVLCELAVRTGQFTWPMTKISIWQRENQKRHQLRPVITLAQAVNAMARRLEPIFSSDLLETALTCSVTEAFANMPISQLPPNLYFWTYNLTERRFEAIHAGNPRFASLPVRKLVRATSSIPGLYGPFTLDGNTYIDALWGKGVRETFREIRENAAHCLFGHMARAGEKGNTLYLRLHDDPKSLRRLGIDFAYFMLDLDNQQVMDNFQRGLFEIEPIPFQE